MKSIFGDIDQLIEQAVAKATETERSLQKKQEKNVKKFGLEAEKEEKKEGVEEAEDDEKSDKKSSDDESAEKIKGKSPDVSPKQTGSKSDSGVTPGTKTSKKLDDPPEKSIANPKFDDISDKVNALRGAGSLKDKNVSSAVKTYLSTLNTAEKSALLTYLTNLAQIMAPVKSPKDVKDPSEIGIKTTFKKGSSISKKSGSKIEEPKQKGNEPADVVVVGGK